LLKGLYVVFIVVLFNRYAVYLGSGGTPRNSSDDDEDDVEPLQQEPPTTEDEDAMDEEPLPGPSRPKRMKT